MDSIIKIRNETRQCNLSSGSIKYIKVNTTWYIDTEAHLEDDSVLVFYRHTFPVVTRPELGRHHQQSVEEEDVSRVREITGGQQRVESIQHDLVLFPALSQHVSGLWESRMCNRK